MFKMLQMLSVSVLTLATSARAEETCPDLSLVLAIDSSSSIDASEFHLQMEGYGAAFRNPVIKKALSDTGIVDVAVVFWSGSIDTNQIEPWMRIRTEGDAMAISEWFLSARRKLRGDTELGNGLTSALDLIERHQTCGLRRVVNVSGDGRAPPGSSRGPARTTLRTAKARAESMGVTVNGLAILNEDPNLSAYYRSELISGPGCFVMEVHSFDDFAGAILEKLNREIKQVHSASVFLETAAFRAR